MAITRRKFSEGQTNFPYVSYSQGDPDPPVAYTLHELKIDKAGGGDYTTITAALNYCNNLIATNNAAKPSATHRYRLNIAPGMYDNESGISGVGLYLLDYCDLIGAGKERTFIKGIEGEVGQESSYDTINKVATCTVMGVTIIAYKVKYCIHIDQTSPTNYVFNLIDCNLRHYGGTSAVKYDIGFGMQQNQVVNIHNCTFSGEGMFGHGNVGNRYTKQGWALNMYNCSFKEFNFIDSMEYNDNVIKLIGCTCQKFKIQYDDSYYDASPENTTRNKGYLPKFTQLDFEGSKIGFIEYFDTDTITTIFGGERLVVPGLNEKVVNKSGSTISKGYAVKQLADTNVVAAAYPSPELSYNRVSLYDGSGIFWGFAEDDISNNTIKTIQISGMPLAFCNASTAIAYGDDLELNSSGQVVKRTSGRLIGQALEAKASGTGLIKIKLNA